MQKAITLGVESARIKVRGIGTGRQVTGCSIHMLIAFSFFFFFFRSAINRVFFIVFPLDFMNCLNKN